MTTTNENVRLWSVTTGTANAAVDASISSSDSQSPDTVDNNIRSIMTAVKRQADDQGGWIVAGGTATALTATTASGITTAMLANGLRLCVRTASASTGAATIAVDAAAATSIKKQGGAAIAAGDWASGDILDLVYSSTASAFLAANISGSLSSATASFSAHKNGVDQTISSISPTKVTFGTELFDVGALFATSTWTPPAGKALINAAIIVTNATPGEALGLHLYKNGASFKAHVIVIDDSVNNTSLAITAIVSTNGSDTWEIYVDSITDSSYLVNGGTNSTWFEGTMI